MKEFAKKLSAMVMCVLFVTMPVSASIMTGDTGLGAGNGGAVINDATGGYVGTDLGDNSATLKFNGDSLVNWDSLNVNSGETLNFNAVDGASGITVVNTVNSGMSNIYGQVSSNQGIAKLIISNPNGMLFDGAKFTTAGDLQLTTQALAVNYLNGNIDISGLNQEAINGIVIKNSNFGIGGEFNIVAPSIEVVGGYLGAARGLNLITKDGQNFLVCPTTSNSVNHKAVRLQAVEIDGNVYILSGKDAIAFVDGGKINGDVKIDSKGSVGLNFISNGNKLEITGNVDAATDAKVLTMRNAKVGKDVKMSNAGGYVEIGNAEVGGNVNLKTTNESNTNTKHFVHVIGDNKIAGNLDIDSVHNIHIGGYGSDLQTLAPGSLKVDGNINALAHDGSIAVTVDTTANKVALTSENLNIVTDGNALITANEYEFAAKQYIGGIKDTNYLINTVMEGYAPIGRYIVGDQGFVNIAGGNVTKFEQDNSSYAFLKSNGNMNIDNINAGKLYVTSNSDIVIGDNAVADTIKVGGETRNLTVKLPNRDYTLKYTDIRDNQVVTINGNTEITYDMANGANGLNNGTQTAQNTYLVVAPPTPTPVNPPTDDPEKILNNLSKDAVASAVDAQQVMTPVAFAADLDDEIDTGVRKNVDGSVTVVRPFTPVN